jgi:hypothetical protein
MNKTPEIGLLVTIWTRRVALEQYETLIARNYADVSRLPLVTSEIQRKLDSDYL